MHKIIVLALVVALAGCTDESDPAKPTSDPPSPGETTFINQTGVLTAIPLIGPSTTGTFDMPNGSSAFAVFAGDGLELVLDDPNGEPHGPGELPVVEGTWTYTVSGEVAVQTAWSFSIQVSAGTPFDGYLHETVSVPPSQFFEINTQMPLAGTFCWDWTSSADVAFDVHSHFDDEVQYLVEKTTDADEDCFTNEREGGYSLLWANEGAVPVSLTYTVWGDFEVDSYFPPR